MGGTNKKNVILALTVILAYATTAKSDNRCKNANCPTYDGTSIIVPNPNECESFCVCTCDGANYMLCPDGLYYNKENHMCDWPSNSGCDPYDPTKTTTVKPKPPNGCDKVKPLCPPTNEGEVTILPNPDDCGSYCICDWGNAIWMPCPTGLQFNPILHVCDWPAHAGCEPGPFPTPNPGPDPPIPNPCDKVKPLCPPTNEGNATILPNPDDCGSYCVCDWGNAIWMPCPNGLDFNPILHVCDWPDHAGCKPGPGPTPNPGPTPTKRPEPPTPNPCDKVKPLCPPTNEGNATLLPNPDDCGSYCVCDWGNAIWMPCPAGLNFNPILHVCDWPDHAGCKPGPAPTLNPRPTPNPDPTPTKRPEPPTPNPCDKVKPLCPPTNEGEATILPNPDDCGSYCICDWGNAIWMPCPTGLQFNPILHVCDWPAHAGCEPGPFPTSNPGPDPPIPNPCDKVKPLCPPTNEGNATILPNPDDCGSYCVCDWGNAIWMPCPNGLDFNPILHVCDWPDHAGCKPGPGPTPNPGPTPTKRPEPPTPNPCDKVKPLCPPTNEGNATLLPNPDDCGSYCVCDWGNAIWMPCPAGLNFNPILHVCDWPDHAGCKPGPAPTLNPRPTPNPDPTPTKRPEPPTPNPCDKVKPLCPPTNEGEATILPNPDDCGSYCICDWGNAIWMPCPTGLQFNPILHVCDWPAHAGCEPGPFPTSNPGPDPPIPNPCDKVKPLCPPTNEGNATILPNPDDCGSYCVCDWGNAIWMPCPNGLDFNPILHVCDWPDHAGCKPGPGPTLNPGPTPTKRPEPPTPNSCDKVKPLCPPTNEGNATLLPNPDDCGSYCVCDWGNAIWMPCPAGLNFNPILHVCDWPDHAGCKPGPAPTLNPRPTPNPDPTPTKRPEPPTPNPCDKVKPLCPPTNEGEATILPNPDDCGSYCICDWGNAIWMPCPTGLQFNPILHVCDWPAHAGCEPGPFPTPNPGPDPPIPNPCDKVKPLCPPTNEGNATILPNPDDCGSYCMCDWGNAIWMPCPNGLDFNPILHVCDWPDHAGCKPGPGPTPNPGPTPTKRPEPPSPNPCDKVKPLCPPTNEGEATILPNPDDCGSYCICDWGNAILMLCPTGLQFNPILHVCDWPAHAGCEPGPFPTSNPGPDPPIPNPCDKVKPLCPLTNEGNATILPNPDDCGSYCVCDWGNAIWMPCPNGLDFNPILHVCDWPDHAGCKPGPGPTPNPGPTPTKRPEPPTPNPCDKVKPLCPPTNEGNATLLPNPDDCGSYCVCDWGNAIWMPCPAGLNFNPILHVCDWPDHAGCKPGPAPTLNPRPTPNPDPTPTKRPEPPTPNPCDKVKPLCPPTNEGEATILPNPDDCGSYCICDWGNAIWMPCPTGLQFNPILHVCDWPAHAGCEPGPFPTPNPGPDPPIPNPCDKVKPLCPPTNEGNATILPNPDDCGSYCMCDWGNAIWMPCPNGLDFNPILHVCDWPDHAGCKPGPGPTPNPGPTPTKRPEPPTPNPCDKVKPFCPPTNEGNATLLPNPDDCGSYCVCDWGNAIWMPCPADLHFNPFLHVCDWPDHAGCIPIPAFV